MSGCEVVAGEAECTEGLEAPKRHMQASGVEAWHFDFLTTCLLQGYPRRCPWPVSLVQLETVPSVL